MIRALLELVRTVRLARSIDRALARRDPHHATMPLCTRIYVTWRHLRKG